MKTSAIVCWDSGAVFTTLHFLHNLRMLLKARVFVIAKPY